MTQVGILEAKTRLSALVEQIEAGGEAIVITRPGRPVAKLGSLDDRPTRPRSRFGDADRVERLERLGVRLQEAHPDLVDLSWEDMKALARE